MPSPGYRDGYQPLTLTIIIIYYVFLCHLSLHIYHLFITSYLYLPISNTFLPIS